MDVNECRFAQLGASPHGLQEGLQHCSMLSLSAYWVSDTNAALCIHHVVAKVSWLTQCCSNGSLTRNSQRQ